MLWWLLVGDTHLAALDIQLRQRDERGKTAVASSLFSNTQSPVTANSISWISTYGRVASLNHCL